jgi:DNA processing protein
MSIFSPFKKEPAQENESNNHQKRMAWLRLARSPSVGYAALRDVMQYYGDPVEAVTQMQSHPAFRKFKLIDAEIAEREMQAVDEAGGQMIFPFEDTYPERLKHIADPPLVLTILGRLAPLHHEGLAIVGTRNASVNGCKMTAALVQELGKAGLVITSGMARGIDTAAHEAAVQFNVPTVAVLAGGANHIYPRENIRLYQNIIASGGAIVAEGAWGSPPSAKLFPKRNRIVSGLSLGVVVVEAALRSGSLITARLALEQNRDVFAIPGFPMDKRAEGPNSLIKQGATLITSAQDILDSLGGNAFQFALRETPDAFDFSALEPKLESAATASVTVEQSDQPQDADEDKILSALSHAPIAFDDLLDALDIPLEQLQSALMMLEMDGKITRLSGNRLALTGNLK